MQKIGIALEGGGLKGSYQIGAYYAFLACHIKINGIVGTSIGSFNACLIAAHQEEKLLELWQNLHPETLLDINKELVDYVNGKNTRLSGFKGLNKTILSTLKTKGLQTDKLKILANNLIDKEKLYNSKIDFGLVTVRLHDLSPVYVYKNDIPKEKLVDYLIASCSLPIFKLTPLIDKHIYVDGGFYDNCPVSMLINQGYDKIYEIKINGIGHNRKVNHQKYNITTIKPSRNICKILEMNYDKIEENILLGYYDTLRVLKNYDGYKFTFYRTSEWYLKYLTRKVSKSSINRLKNLFKVATIREIVIKSIEYTLEKEKYNYYEIYYLPSIIRKIKKNIPSKPKNMVYKFILTLRII